MAWTDNRNFATNGTDVVYVKSTDGGNDLGAGYAPEPRPHRRRARPYHAR